MGHEISWTEESSLDRINDPSGARPGRVVGLAPVYTKPVKRNEFRVHYSEVKPSIKATIHKVAHADGFSPWRFRIKTF
jgi:hypothetical protein